MNLGELRPGATVLAVADGVGGADDAVVAIQRYGAGRSMVFAGEASWRWKMLRPADDGTYDRFWRQAVRWLTVDAPDRVQVLAPPAGAAGDDVPLLAEVRDAEFRPVADASVRATLTAPDGTTSAATAALVDAARGRYAITVPAGEPGVHRARLQASRGGAQLGTADVPWLAGGEDRELGDPRLDEMGLRQLADASGGAYLTPDHARDAGQYLLERAVRRRPVEWREAWQTVWMLCLIVALVSVEWILRRQWGLR